MSFDISERDLRLSKGLAELTGHHTVSSHIAMDAAAAVARMRKRYDPSPIVEARKLTEDYRYQHSLSQGASIKKPVRSSYFSIESLLLLVCLTASLLILPLVLPPLPPPPPFWLLLLPIGVFGLLMVLAFMPYNVET